jgi:exodeoxyribonuclease VII large subunit
MSGFPSAGTIRQAIAHGQPDPSAEHTSAPNPKAIGSGAAARKACYKRVAVKEEEVISVAELDRRLRRAVEAATGREWVSGEVTSLKWAPSGHAYFCLKDEADDAVVDCVMYKFHAARARRFLAPGARVQLRGRATVYAPRGRLQLVGEALRPAGQGALLIALEELKRRLAAEGMFEPARKRPLPPDPQIVGVVTSGSGAAFHDIRTVAFRRGGVRLVISPALVQGDHAPDRIVRAVELIERYPGLDVLIVGRGGGSSDDLMAFNDERVVRRIAQVSVPVVSAVGHEVDFTLVDLVADVRAATPSQAAELVIPDSKARRDTLARCTRQLARAMGGAVRERRGSVDRLRAQLGDPRFLVAERQQQLDELSSRLERHTTRERARRRAGLEALHRRLSARHPRSVLAEAKSSLGPLAARLDGSIDRRLGRARAELEQAAARLDGLSPLSVLGRGYAIAIGAEGRAVRAAREVAPGQMLRLRLHAGRLLVEVAEVEVEP